MTTAPRTPARDLHALIMETPVQARCSVEIESMSRGIPKVKVRVNDDDPDHAKLHAVRVYHETLALLKDGANLAREEEEVEDSVAPPPA